MCSPSYCRAKTTWTVAVTVEVPGLVGGGEAQAAVRFVAATGDSVVVGGAGLALVPQPAAGDGAALASNSGVSCGPSPSSIVSAGPSVAPARLARAAACPLALSKAAPSASANAFSVSPTK